MAYGSKREPCVQCSLWQTGSNYSDAISGPYSKRVDLFTFSMIVFTFQPTRTSTHMQHVGCHFLQLDDAIASSGICYRIRVERVGGRKRLWSQLNNAETVTNRPYMSMGANRNQWAGYRMGPSPTPHAALTPKLGEGRKVSLSNCSQTVGDGRKCQ